MNMPNKPPEVRVSNIYTENKYQMFTNLIKKEKDGK